MKSHLFALGCLAALVGPLLALECLMCGEGNIKDEYLDQGGKCFHPDNETSKTAGCSSCFVRYSVKTRSILRGCYSKDEHWEGCVNSGVYEYCTCKGELCNDQPKPKPAPLRCYECLKRRFDKSPNQEGSCLEPASNITAVSEDLKCETCFSAYSVDKSVVVRRCLPKQMPVGCVWTKQSRVFHEVCFCNEDFCNGESIKPDAKSTTEQPAIWTTQGPKVRGRKARTTEGTTAEAEAWTFGNVEDSGDEQPNIKHLLSKFLH